MKLARRVKLARRAAEPPSTTDGRRLVAVWLLTRLVMVALCFAYRVMPRDLSYYATQAHAHSLVTGLREYPFPIAVALMLPARVLPYAVYVGLYVASVLVADALVARMLDRRVARRAAWWWVVLIALHGPLVLMRFDVWVAVALVVALVAMAPRPAVSGFAVAAASAVKLWPAVFGVGLLGPARRRVTHTGAALVGGLAWAGVTVAVAGFDRLMSPLRWQGERGFEVESLGGTVMGVARVFGSAELHRVKRQGSWEYVGPLAREWQWIVQPLQLLGYAVIVVLLALGAWVGRDARRATAALTMTAVIGVFILTSPVISPQYLIWLVPGLVLLDDTRVRSLGCVTLALTQLEFPILFDGVLTDVHAFEAVTLLVIVARNVVLVWLAVRAVILLVRHARGRQSRASSSSTSPATPA